MSALERKRVRAIEFARRLLDEGRELELFSRTSVGTEAVETERVDRPECAQAGFYVQAWIFVSDADVRR